MSASDPPALKGILKLPEAAAHDEILKMNWLVEGWFELEDIVLWAGDPGIGKSIMALSMAVSLASGQPIFGIWPHPTGSPLKVAMLDFENRETVILRRLIRLARGLGIDPSTFYPEYLSIFSLRGRGIFGATDSATLLRRHIESGLEALQPTTIIMDTIMSATDQDDLSPLAGVRFIRDFVMTWAKKFGSGFHALHHNKKPDERVSKSNRIGDLYQASGGGFVGMADALVLVQTDEDSNIIITNPKQRHTKQSGRLYLHLEDGGHGGPLKLLLSPDPPPSNKPKHISWEGIKKLFGKKSRTIGEIPFALLSTDIVDFLQSAPKKYSQSTSTAILNELIKDDLLIDHGPFMTGDKGRPPRILTITPSSIKNPV